MAGVFGWVAGWVGRNFLLAPEIAAGELRQPRQLAIPERLGGLREHTLRQLVRVERRRPDALLEQRERQRPIEGP